MERGFGALASPVADDASKDHGNAQRSLGGELLAGGLATRGLAGGLLGAGHFDCCFVRGFCGPNGRAALRRRRGAVPALRLGVSRRLCARRAGRGKYHRGAEAPVWAALDGDAPRPARDMRGSVNNSSDNNNISSSSSSSSSPRRLQLGGVQVETPPSVGTFS